MAVMSNRLSEVVGSDDTLTMAHVMPTAHMEYSSPQARRARRAQSRARSIMAEGAFYQSRE
jgi:hypothetical protein